MAFYSKFCFNLSLNWSNNSELSDYSMEYKKRVSKFLKKKDFLMRLLHIWVVFLGTLGLAEQIHFNIRDTYQRYGRYRQDRNERFGGIAFLVKRDQPHHQNAYVNQDSLPDRCPIQIMINFNSLLHYFNKVQANLCVNSSQEGDIKKINWFSFSNKFRKFLRIIS